MLLKSAKEDAANWSSSVGIVAGNGQLPFMVVKELKKRGVTPIVVAHLGETDRSIETLCQTYWVKVGELGKIIDLLSKQVRQVVFAGGIKRPKLFGGNLKLDLRGLALIARLRTTRDDALLRGIAEELEQSGLVVRSASELLTEVSALTGQITKRGLSESELNDAKIGWAVAKSLGAADVGQTVVVFQGTVIAVEALEGTDATIQRAGELVERKGGVVVKVSKPSQDMRLDLPTVGPSTISAMSRAGMTALVLEAKKSILIDEEAVIERADSKAIAVMLPSSDSF